MALMDDWRDKRNNEDFIVADDINSIAHAIIELQRAFINGVLNGYTPQKGKDYWTNEDIAEIKSYVDESILGGAW